MKKLIKLFILVLIPILVCSCTKEEHSLIELTSEELILNLSNSEKSFVFATTNSKKDNTAEFLESLNNVVSSANIDIYYIDYQYVDIGSLIQYYMMYESDLSINAYYVYEKGTITVGEEYTDFTTMYQNLKNKSFSNDLEYISNETKQSYLKEAEEKYNSGLISEASDLLCKAWNIKEAKEMYENNSYYKMIDVWEHFTITEEGTKTIDYRTILFGANENYYLYYQETAPYNSFSKPTTTEGYKMIYYYIEDDFIYTSDERDGKYKKTYEVESVDSIYFKITDVKTNTKYIYTKRG